MSESRYLTREEASIACGVSIDTLRRDQRLGKLPQVRTRADGVVEIPVSDLVAATSFTSSRPIKENRIWGVPLS